MSTPNRKDPLMNQNAVERYQDTTSALRGVNESPQKLAIRENNDKLELIKQTYAAEQNLTDLELELFVSHANALGLNIIKRQIYAVKRQGKMGIQVGIDGFRTLSASDPNFAGVTEPEWCGQDGVWHDVWTSDEPPMFARVGVYRRGFPRPTYGVAKYSEFVQMYFDQYAKKQKPTPMWQKMPANQLAKCAEAQAHRKAFPGKLAGLEPWTGDDRPTIGAPTDDDFVEAAPRPTPQVVATIETDTEENRKRALSRIHAVAAEHKITHDDLSRYAKAKGVVSLSKLTADQLDAASEFIQTRTDEALAWFSSTRPIEAEVVDSTQPAESDDEVEYDPATGEVIPSWVGRGESPSPVAQELLHIEPEQLNPDRYTK